MRKLLIVVCCVLCVGAWSQQFHIADQNEDALISVSELLRVIQFFNSDGYHCEAGTEDDYAPGPGDITCLPHASDYNSQDWEINLSELLRLIQFFNSGGYHTDCASEDTYGAGPGSHEVCDFETETIMLPGDVPLVMKRIPAGSFMMGANPGGNEIESPQHLVTFSDDFWMAKYEVTQVQWVAVMGSGLQYDGDNRPRNQVSWLDAWEFIVALNELTGLNFGLPTEAQWEYSCRADTTTPYYWDDPNIAYYGWFGANSSMQTHDVGEKLPNSWGLYDMCGNVSEWCRDDWHYDYIGAPDDGMVAWRDNPRGTYRVVRGGDVVGDVWESTERRGSTSNLISTTIGFRLTR